MLYDRAVDLDVAALSDSPSELKQTIRALLSRIATLEAQLANHTRYRFGTRSEKLSLEDLLKPGSLFSDDALVRSMIQELHEAKDAVTKVREIKAHTRRVPTGRTPISDKLPREIVPHEPSEEERNCPCCGKARPIVSTDTREEIEYVPATAKVLVHEYPVMGPCTCTDFIEKELPEVVTTKREPRMLPGTMAGPGLLSQIITSKFDDGSPLYRQEKIFSRIGLELNRTTMSNWIIEGSKSCRGVVELFLKLIRMGIFIQMDETTLQVLKEYNRPPSAKSYMWVTIGYRNGRPIVVYHYHPERSASIASDILSGFQGDVQTDGYEAYGCVEKRSNGAIRRVGCGAHIRRKFEEASKANLVPGLAEEVLVIMAGVWHVEKETRAMNLAPDEFVKVRKERVVPILIRLYRLLREHKDIVLPETLTGKAINYALGQWSAWVRYVLKPWITPDNNAVERAIRPYVVGRKNWNFCDTPDGARASAIMYSIAETAKANGLEPFKYFRLLFSKLPYAQTEDDLMALMPFNLTREDLEKMQG
jgi:transposase